MNPRAFSRQMTSATAARIALPVLLALLAPIGCGKDPAPSPAPTAPAPAPTAAAVALTGEGVFKARCVPCHGESGKGDGAASASLNPKPRDYTNAAWQASVTDADLRKTIVGGGSAVGKSAAMPANPDLEGKPELDQLIAYVRAFKGK